MNWLLAFATLVMVALAAYSRWSEPVLPYGDERHQALFSGRSFLLGGFYGLLVMAWLFYGSALSGDQRDARSAKRQNMMQKRDVQLKARAKRLAAAEHELSLEDDAKRRQDEDNEWQRQRVHAVDQQTVEEMSGVVLGGKTQGPCPTLRGCVCGLASQFSDSKILARRYRRWCRGFRSLDGEWMCRSQLQVVKSDLYRNRIVLIEKGLAIPSICPQRQSN